MGYLSIERKQVQQSAVPHFFKKKKKKVTLVFGNNQTNFSLDGHIFLFSV